MRDGQTRSRIASNGVALGFAIVFARLACGGAEPERDSPATPTDTLEATVEAYLQPYLDGRNFSGSVLIARGGDILLNNGYGMAHSEPDTPTAANTKFQIASISKSFTAAAILLLREQGTLDLDDPVSRFLPDFPNGDDITIHHLLVHSSGLTRYVFLPDYLEKSQQPQTPEDLVAWIQDKPLAFAPGERSAYSNANFALLAHIIELASGLSYGDFLQANIFDPLELTSTGHRGDMDVPVAGLAVGFTPVGVTDLEDSRYHDYSSATGAGSLYATTKDLYAWHRGLNGERLLARESLDLMFDEHIDSRGYGWVHGRWLDRDVIRMDGWDGAGFSTTFVHFLDDDVTVVVLCNLNVSTLTDEIARNLSAIGLGERHEPLRLVATPLNDVAVTRARAGTYQFGEDFYVPNATMQIVESEGHLFVEGQALDALLRVSDNEFIHRLHWFRVTFDQDEDGQVTGMGYGQFAAKRVNR